MEHDIGDQSSPLKAADLEQAPKLTGLRIERFKAYEWALRDCKFLIFDNTDAKTNGYDRDDENGMPKCVMGMPKEERDEVNENSLAKCKGKGKEVAPPDSSLEIQDEDKHEHEEKCQICSSLPEFPHDRKTQKFRLFRPRDSFPELQQTMEHNCFHYVAVSYCWPIPTENSQDKTQKKGSYQIRDIDGSVRQNRALDDVIDRAVDVATSFGLRMVWIDQECLPQPTEKSPQHEKDEQQIGIQAMDILYARAVVTAGLHSLEISTQAQADALFDTLYPKRAPQRRHSIDLIIDFLQEICRDRWYTRAWVVQESLSAGRRLVLVFRRADGIKYKSTFRIRQKHLGIPEHSLDSQKRVIGSNVVCMEINQFRRIVQSADAFITGDAASHLEVRQVGRMRFVKSIVPDSVIHIIHDAERLHPSLMTQSRQRADFQLFKGKNSWKRDRVDAAGALTLLKTRGCRDTQDLIVIMANMCDYEVRLDSNAVAKQCKSLRVALLTLAIINGDFSLFVPELFGQYNPELDGRITHTGTNHRWLYPFDTQTPSIDHVCVRSFYGSRLRHTTRSEDLFNLPAYAWKVEDTIDLTPIKVKWIEEWVELKCLKIYVKEFDGESIEDFSIRRDIVSKPFSRGEVIQMANYEMLEKGLPSLPDDSILWSEIDRLGINRTGALVMPVLIPERIEADEEKRSRIGRIFFDILRFLYFQADTDPKALGVANSIWHSLRVDIVPNGYGDSLPDEVGPALFDHPDVVARPFETMQLERSPDGQYHQLWLFDRIMSAGYLWVGRYKRSTDPLTMWHHNLLPRMDSDQVVQQFIGNISAPEGLYIGRYDSGGTLLETDPGLAPHQIPTLDQRIPYAELRFDHAESSKSGAAKHEYRDLVNSILMRQKMQQIMTNLGQMSKIDSLLKAHTNEGEDEDKDSGVWRINMDLITNGTYSFEDEQCRMATLVSVFDVDGPCHVATVYNADWEILPHSDLRSMSVCWVVEELKQPEIPYFEPGSANERSEEEGQRIKRRKIDVEAKADGTRSEVTPLSAPELREREQGIVKKPLKHLEHFELLYERYKKTKRCYRVLGKVRGMWRLMDFPSQSYEFS